MKILFAFWVWWSPTAAYHSDVGFRLGACQYQIHAVDLGYAQTVAVKWHCPWRGE